MQEMRLQDPTRTQLHDARNAIARFMQESQLEDRTQTNLHDPMIVKRISSGVPGLDAMIEGGFLTGRSVLLAGGPGAGKTVACGQFLHHGITHHERGIYVSLDENRERFYHEMSRFGWKFDQLEREGLFRFLDASPTPDLEMDNHHSLSQIVKSVDRLILDLDAKRVVVDGLAALGFEFPDAVDRRKAFLSLIQTLSNSNVTSLLTSEIRISALDRPIQVEEYLADGAIVMQTLLITGSLNRTIHVEKMRGTLVDAEIRPYTITSNGIKVFNTEKVL